MGTFRQWMIKENRAEWIGNTNSALDRIDQYVAKNRLRFSGPRGAEILSTTAALRRCVFTFMFPIAANDVRANSGHYIERCRKHIAKLDDLLDDKNLLDQLIEPLMKLADDHAYGRNSYVHWDDFKASDYQA